MASGSLPEEHVKSYATRENPFEPIEPRTDLDPARVTLGERLFQDPILSSDGKVACTTCHLFEKFGGADGRDHSKLAERAVGPGYNTPTIFNVGNNYKYNWTGQYDTLEEQLTAPLTKAAVMNNKTVSEVVDRLAKSVDYKAEFTKAYKDGVTEDNLRDAIASYERSLATPNAKFDKYLRGDKTALDAEELEGYGLFKSRGCVACHQGMNVGGNLRQPIGVLREYYKETPAGADRGRFNDTKKQEDMGVFRVPSLRNVQRTAPYFHNGAATSLEEAVNTMAEVQLGQSLTPRENALIVSFLKTLTGSYAGRPL